MVVAKQHAEGSHDGCCFIHWTPRERAVAFECERGPVDSGKHWDGQAREQSRFACVEQLQPEIVCDGTYAGDNQRAAVLLYRCAQGARRLQGRFAVFTWAVVVQVGSAFGKCCGEYCPLGETLRRRHPEALAVETFHVSVDGLAELLGHRLAGGCGVAVRQGCIGEWRAAFQALYARAASGFAHAESNQAALERIHVFKDYAVQALYACCVFR